MKNNNQADLFDQSKNEDKMKRTVDSDRQKLIDKVKKMSEDLKYKQGGILYKSNSES
jgi:hypothetical protein